MKQFLFLIFGFFFFFSLSSVSRAANEPVQMREAESVSDCGGTLYNGKLPQGATPDTLIGANCIFLEEPIGGKPGYDMYVISCSEKSADGKQPAHCKYDLWSGGPVTPPKKGPVQAVLSYEKGKQWQSSFGLLYNYVGIVYKYLSGLIIGVVVLITAFGGIEIATAGGDSQKVTNGKDHILHALLGMVLWFLASLILYTINPTFFRF